MRIAVVDMAAVLRGSKQWRDAAEERLRLMERMRRTLTKLSQQVQVLRNEYENLPPGTDERRLKEQEISSALQELQQNRSDFEARIAENHNEAARELFRRISEAVSAHADQHDLDLVLKKQSLDLAGEETVEQSLLLATTEVLYADPSLDISAAIVERINADYPGPIEAK
jgi:Skp family chaperone for outer membrane proteins